MNMKQIWFVILFMVAAGNIALAGDADFTGKWIVAGDDVGKSGITVTVNDRRPPILNAPGQVRTYRDGTAIRDWDTSESQDRLYDFTVISAGTFFDFAANGSKLTGSMLRGETEEPVFDGKISGNKISFTVKETIAGKTYSYFYVGELSGIGIQFEVTPQERDAGSRFKFSVRRETR